MTDLVERWPASTAQLVLAGRVDPRVLAVLLALAGRFSLAGVGPFVSGHSYYVAGSNRPSNHAFGRAVDIGTINRELVSPANGAARQAALALASLPTPLRPDEIGSPFAELSALPGLFSDAGARTTVRMAMTTSGVLFELNTEVVRVEPGIEHDERPQPRRAAFEVAPHDSERTR
jgi:hypothetical protein